MSNESGWCLNIRAEIDKVTAQAKAAGAPASLVDRINYLWEVLMMALLNDEGRRERYGALDEVQRRLRTL